LSTQIVVAADSNEGLAGPMGRHFGRCPFFVLAWVNDSGDVEKTQIHANPHTAKHSDGEVPRFIHGLGADVVIAAGMGHRAIAWFEQLGIEVATGSRTNIGQTLKAYLSGEITGASGCAHDRGESKC
jgi:predicted Fe-Mo cluster-binding NifX family protein